MKGKPVPNKNRDPHKPAKSGETTKTAIGESCRVECPELRIKIKGRSTWGNHFAKAHFRIRRGKYVYLVWRDGAELHEVYVDAEIGLQSARLVTEAPRKPLFDPRIVAGSEQLLWPRRLNSKNEELDK